MSGTPDVKAPSSLFHHPFICGPVSSLFVRAPRPFHGRTMETLRRLSTRRTIGPVLSGLIVALSVVVPLTEIGSVTHEVAVEGPHHAASCPRAHDHRICTQVGLNLPLSPTVPGLRSIAVGSSTGSGAPPALRPSVHFAPGALPRAPPA